MSRTIFICGSVTGPENNAAQFQRVANKLRSMGYHPIYPHWFFPIFDQAKIGPEEFLRKCVHELTEKEGTKVLTINGWDSQNVGVKFVQIARSLSIEVESEIRFFQE